MLDVLGSSATKSHILIVGVRVLYSPGNDFAWDATDVLSFWDSVGRVPARGQPWGPLGAVSLERGEGMLLTAVTCAFLQASSSDPRVMDSLSPLRRAALLLPLALPGRENALN